MLVATILCAGFIAVLLSSAPWPIQLSSMSKRVALSYHPSFPYAKAIESIHRTNEKQCHAISRCGYISYFDGDYCIDNVTNTNRIACNEAHLMSYCGLPRIDIKNGMKKACFPWECEVLQALRCMNSSHSLFHENEPIGCITAV